MRSIDCGRGCERRCATKTKSKPRPGACLRFSRSLPTKASERRTNRWTANGCFVMALKRQAGELKRPRTQLPCSCFVIDDRFSAESISRGSKRRSHVEKRKMSCASEEDVKQNIVLILIRKIETFMTEGCFPAVIRCGQTTIPNSKSVGDTSMS